ncbi:hypothetical protein D1631_00045 [Chryseobacterium nematophagum]|uniref:Uncharacterized protein n=1 Tax=Chryseobacterium nematophagum TaxID=2305228 RepID=A0A3M7TLJ8_9FLAO|nr:hypothetical protein [Chryseobacterium nematophagum]RNA63936.1 hypothetical protein D1631_00045 [Chryseobacterium nematophagum]
MKKYLFILLTALGAIFFNSCAKDGDWEDGRTGGQFGFTIERDDNFIEKGIGEVNQLKFNIQTNYDFSMIKTSFKYTTSLNGSLKLNGQLLNANQEYNFTSKNNIFEYIGNVSGTHNLKFTVKNSKGSSKEEEFSLPYSISEFTHTYTGGTAEIFQGDDTQYLLKILPGAGQPTTGYEIKFNSYSGTVKLNGVTATMGQYYILPNIDNFNLTLNTNVAGQGAVHYTIKNNTVSKDYSIQQTVTQRQITLESMNINSTTVPSNTVMSIVGVVKKTPITGNLNVQYKTWISSASNNNTNGIQNTNNVYTPYTLGSTGNFNYSMNSVATGIYIYNIQFKDEFGNESDVKSFNVEVGAPLTFIGQQSAKLVVSKSPPTPIGYSYITTGFYKSFKIEANPAKVISIDYTLNYDFNGTPITQSITQPINLQSSVEYLDEFTTAGLGLGFINNASAVSNATLKIKVNANDGTSLEKIVPMTIEYKQ